MKIVVDTGVLLLWVVGLAGPELIEKHPRLSRYNSFHFDFLALFVEDYSGIVVTPYSLAELYAFIGEVKKTNDFDRIKIHLATKVVIEDSLEIRHPAKTIVNHDCIQRFGITDVSQIQAAKRGHAFLTIDGRLHDEALRQNIEAFNFDHIIENLN